MIEALNLSLREVLGARGTIRYLEQVILPELERLEKEGRLQPHEIRKIADVIKEKGLEALEPKLTIHNEATRNTLERDGYILDAELRLTDEASIRQIFKKFSRKEDLRNAVEAQSRINSVLRGTKYEKIVPEVGFIDKSRRIISTPYISGQQLSKELGDKDLKEKEAILQRTIDQYAEFFRYINKDEIKDKTRLPASMKDFNQLFLEYYLGNTENKELLEQFRGDIGTELNSTSTQNVHGDFHPGNIIANGKQVYLDWATAASNGFTEIDICKLLRKSDIPQDLEERLAEYASRRLYDQEEDQKRSIRRYKKNQIVEDLFAAKRYLRRSDEANTENVKGRLKAMAQVFYNNALRRLERASKERLVSEGLILEIKKAAPSSNGYQLHELTDEEFEILRKEYNPDSHGSHENRVTATPAPALLEEIIDSGTKALRREIKHAKRKRLGKFVAGALAVLVAVTSPFVAKKYTEYKNERTKLIEKLQEYEKSRYREIFTGAFDDLKKAKINLPDIVETFDKDSEIINKVALEYNLDSALLRRMIDVNRYYAKMQWSDIPRNQELRNLCLLDPFIASRGHPTEKVLQPIPNLRAGAKRLANLIKKYGDVETGVLAFYYPIEKGEWKYGTAPELETAKPMLDEVRTIAYNAINGYNAYPDAGIYAIDLRKPSADFPKLDRIRKENCRKVLYSTLGELCADDQTETFFSH